MNRINCREMKFEDVDWSCGEKIVPFKKASQDKTTQDMQGGQESNYDNGEKDDYDLRLKELWSPNIKVNYIKCSDLPEQTIQHKNTDVRKLDQNAQIMQQQKETKPREVSLKEMFMAKTWKEEEMFFK